MTQEEWANRIDRRLDKIEEKIDDHMERVAETTADVQWIKGYIRVSISAMITLATGVIASLFQAFVK